MLPAVLEAGVAVMKYFTAADYVIEHKDHENPVTSADFAANSVLVQAIRKYFPADAILSEEIGDGLTRDSMNADRLQKKRVWILDPIDGTRDFIKGRAQFAISVGLIENGKPILGFIHNPAAKYMLSGGPSLGLLRYGLPIKLSSHLHHPSNHEVPKITVSRTEYKNHELDFIEAKIPDLKDHIIGSIAYKLALVADGTYDLTISVRPKNEWDIAGGAALLEAVGYQLLEGDGQPVSFNKANTESLGLMAGKASAIEWYRKFLASRG